MDPAALPMPALPMLDLASGGCVANIIYTHIHVCIFIDRV